MRIWALWRRLVYGTSFLVVIGFLGVGIYSMYWYVPPTCFDEVRNGLERGVDCGGTCTRICSADTLAPKVLWTRAFRNTKGLYNVVAYVENRNLNVGAPELHYTVKLYDNNGLIVEKKNVTVLPPDSVYPIFEGRIETGERVPTQAHLELEKDTLWLPATLGREQFSVKARELISADTKPRLTATLENTALDEARDVEVIATIFDARGVALNASRTVIPILRGRATEDVVFTWQEPIAKTLRSCEVPTDVLLAIDVSGSMNNDGSEPPEPVTSVLRAAESFAKRLNEHDQGGLVTYASEIQVPQLLTKDKVALAEAVRALTITPEAEQGGTNIGDALLTSANEFFSERHNGNARKVLVLFTDGLANEPGETPEQYAIDTAAFLKNAGIEIFTIGLGTTVNEAFLKTVASDEAHYFNAPTTGTVDSVYRSVTAAMCEEGAAVIEIVPKTTASFTPLQ